MNSIGSSDKFISPQKSRRDGVFYYEVALPQAVTKNLIYTYSHQIALGSLVKVPLRNKVLAGVVLQAVTKPRVSFECRFILSVDSCYPALSSARLQWLLWLASYYQYSLGLVVHLSFPRFLQAGKKIKKKLPSQKENPKQAVPVVAVHKKKNLTLEQKKCLQEIQAIGESGFRVHLIHGVTGSGKTEIYFQLIRPALLMNKTVLVLVPEIALTPQHIARFSEQFPGRVTCLHSGMTDREKRIQWTEVLKGEKSILIGPRSALFCPMPRLAWIILDEEHEGHFKQEEQFKYHARDSAVVLGKYLNIPVVLSSATPSLESWWNAQEGKYHYHHLKKRVFNQALPRVELVNMSTQSRSHKKKAMSMWWMSDSLYQAIKDTLNKQEQVALFLNRRGEAPLVFCSFCAWRARCPNCDISLTKHYKSHLICHYCYWREEKPDICPQCGEGEGLSSLGLGTEALEKDMHQLFPSARILRADRDEISSHKEWAACITQVENKQVDILIGTQMIAKGLDFPSLTLVGVVCADQGLHSPDFRSSEKVFQMMTQIAGRAGRRAKPGRVILQSYNPAHPVLQTLVHGNYQQFAKLELQHRQKYHYPPFSKLLLVRALALDSQRALEAMLRIKARLKNIKELHVLGPAPTVVFRVRNKYRYHLLLKSSSLTALNQVQTVISSISSLPAGVHIQINRDPVSLF